MKSPRQYSTQTNVAAAMQINIDMENAHVNRRAQSKDAASDSKVEALKEVYRATDTRREHGFWQELVKHGAFSAESLKQLSRISELLR
jgi:hypothetical protein